MQSELEESGHGLCIQKRAFRGRKFERIPFRRIVAGRDPDCHRGASELSTASMSVGVDTMPRSTTSQPTDTRPDDAAAASIGPRFGSLFPAGCHRPWRLQYPPSVSRRPRKRPLKNTRVRASTGHPPFPETPPRSRRARLESSKACIQKPFGHGAPSLGESWATRMGRPHEHYPGCWSTVNDLGGLCTNRAGLLWVAGVAPAGEPRVQAGRSSPVQRTIHAVEHVFPMSI